MTSLTSHTQTLIRNDNSTRWVSVVSATNDHLTILAPGSGIQRIPASLAVPQSTTQLQSVEAGPRPHACHRVGAFIAHYLTASLMHC